MATRKTTAKKKTTATKAATATKTTTKKPTAKKITPRQAAKNKTAAKRSAKKSTIKAAAKKTAKKLNAKAAAAKSTTTTKTTAKKITATKKPTTKMTAKKITAANTPAKKTTTSKTTTKTVTLTTGSPAPAFTLPTDTGTVSLSQLRGKNVVLYFYPKDDTPGCTTEACGFRDSLPQFNTLNAMVIGVSKDDTASHKKFKAKYKLPFTLASDTTGDVCERYGVIGTKSMYGKTFTGIIRTTFLIDATGTIRAIWRNVSVTGHVQTVADTLKTLGNSTTQTKTTGKTTSKTTTKKKAA